MTIKLLITGSTGFVGGRLVSTLLLDPAMQVTTLLRARPVGTPACLDYSVVPDFSSIGAHHTAFNSVDVMIHLASRVHVMNEHDPDPLQAFRRVNVEHTMQLARSAAEAGVRRFIFISSVKVNGEATLPGSPYTETDAPAPKDPYGISKLEAEIALQAIAAETGMELVIIRPVLVYGPGVRANFESMMRGLIKGVPLPLGALQNKRSLLALDNLVSFIKLCVTHRSAASQTFLISDDQDVSTTQLLRLLATALRCRARLLPVPAWVLVGGAALLGKKPVALRLCGSLQVDIHKARSMLGWEPPVTLEDGLKQTANYFLKEPVK